MIPYWYQTPQGPTNTTIISGQFSDFDIDFSTIMEGIVTIEIVNLVNPFTFYVFSIFDVFGSSSCTIPFFETYGFGDFVAGLIPILLPSGKYILRITNLDSNNIQIGLTYNLFNWN